MSFYSEQRLVALITQPSTTLVWYGNRYSDDYNIFNKASNESESCSVVSNYLQPHGLQPARLLCPWNSPGQNIGVGSLSLPQGILPTQGSSPSLPRCRQILYQLNSQGSPKLLKEDLKYLGHFYSLFILSCWMQIPE